MNNKPIRVNFLLYTFLFLCFTVLINDYITYIININYIVSFMISFFTVLILNIFIKKKNIVEIDNNYSKYDFIFFLLLMFLFLIMFVYPDRTFDTTNYHLYLQENPFGDKIYSDFFAAKNINSFTYAFTDRFAYVFRYIFGYRLGIIFNYFVFITIYYEIKKILKQLIKTEKEIILTVVCILCTFTLSSVELLDSYYIDNISIVFLLELFYLTFFNKYSDKILLYIALLAGFSFVSKISNAFIIIVLALQYLLLHHKEMKKVNLMNLFLSIFIFLFPFFIYMLYTYVSTKNPFFPFYNKIFKSNYYSNSNWMDTRFGPKNIIEILLWPIYMNIYPLRSYDIGIVELTWAIGYIVCFINIIKIIFYKIKNNYKLETIDRIYIFTFLSFLVWSKFMLGYTRYGLVILYYSIICIYVCIYNLIKNKKRILYSLLIISIFVSYIYQLYNLYYHSNSWSFSNYLSNDYHERKVGYKENFKKIFTDRNINIDLGDNSVLGIVYNNAGQATMLNSTNDFVSLSAGVSNSYTKNILDKKLEGKKIYAFTDSIDIDNFINTLNLGYKIVNPFGVYEPDFIDSNNKIYFFEIEKSKKNQNSYFEISKSYSLDGLTPGKYKVSFLGGPGKMMRVMDLSDFSIKLSKCSENRCIDYDEYSFKTQDIYRYEETIEIGQNENIFIRLNDKEGKDVDYFAAMIINLEIEEVE